MTKKTKKQAPRLGFGPGLIVAAAFVGPGTVMTAASAGADYGFGLAWLVCFSVLAAVVLQEMTCRLGTLTGMGLGEMLQRQYGKSRLGWVISGLVLLAIGFGNAAYQTGNLTGAAVGLGGLLVVPTTGLILVLSAIAALLLWLGSYRLLERVLIGAVAAMGLAFVFAAAAAIYRQGISAGDLKPVWPSADWKTMLALIGTTIVPYNLFLHASAASERWSSVRPRGDGLRLARLDSALGIAAGGVVTLAILMATAIALKGESLENAAGAAEGLESILGSRVAKLAFSLGLGAAGLTSAITAPLAAAYAICGVFGWNSDPKSWPFRFTWMIVLGAGVIAALTFGSSPRETIIAAQAANALVLPLIAVILVMACNAKILGKYANRPWQNAAAAIVVLLIVVVSVGRLFV